MSADVFTGPYDRKFVLVSPSLPSDAPAVAWPDIPAEYMEAFLTDCTMDPLDFEARYGRVDRWGDAVHIRLYIATSSEHTLYGELRPARCMIVEEGSTRLRAEARQTAEGLYLLDVEVWLGMQVDGVQLVHTRRHRRDNITIQPDGAVLLL